MANEQNLIPQSERTKDEQREIARLGGIKSGEARREKKIFKEEILKRLNAKDFEEIIDNLIERAKSNDKSVEVLRDTMGQKPKDQVENINTELSYEDYINKVVDKDEY